MTVPQKEYIITEDDLLCIKMLVEDEDDHSVEILKIVQDCLLHPIDTATSAGEVLENFVKKIGLKHSEMVDLMRRNKMKIVDLKDPMQKLAFTFFSEIGEMSHEAEVVLEELQQQQQAEREPSFYENERERTHP